jgi:NAD(P)-dependent dehydrogenase (short-subunit alcohol dehydrogenase family)
LRENLNDPILIRISDGLVLTPKALAFAESLARSIAGDVGRHNITANAIVLGFFMTDILSDVSAQIEKEQGADAAVAFLNEFRDSTALGRIGAPKEIEGLVNLLASDAGSYITGASIPIDGGMSIMMRPLPL